MRMSVINYVNDGLVPIISSLELPSTASSCDVLRNIWDFLYFHQTYKESLVEKNLKLRAFKHDFVQSADDNCAYSFEGANIVNEGPSQEYANLNYVWKVNGDHFSFDSTATIRRLFLNVYKGNETCGLPKENQINLQLSAKTDFKSFIQAKWESNYSALSQFNTMGSLEFHVTPPDKGTFELQNGDVVLDGKCGIREDAVTCVLKSKSSIYSLADEQYLLMYHKYLIGNDVRHELGLSRQFTPYDQVGFLQFITDPVAKSYKLAGGVGSDGYLDRYEVKANVGKEGADKDNYYDRYEYNTMFNYRKMSDYQKNTDFEMSQNLKFALSPMHLKIHQNLKQTNSDTEKNEANCFWSNAQDNWSCNPICLPKGT